MDCPPPAVGIASKWGSTYAAQWRTDAEVNEVKDLSIATLRRPEPETRRQLGSTFSLYQIPSATLESGVLEDRQVLEELGAVAEDPEGYWERRSALSWN